MPCAVFILAIWKDRKNLGTLMAKDPETERSDASIHIIRAVHLLGKEWGNTGGKVGVQAVLEESKICISKRIRGCEFRKRKSEG
jgi:hypothetical protein